MTLSKLEALLLFPLASALLASGLSEVGCSRDDVGSCPAATSSGALLQVLKATSKTAGTVESDDAEEEETKTTGRQGRHAGGGSSRLALDEHISQILKKQGRGRKNHPTAPDVLVELKKLDEMLATAGEWVEGHTGDQQEVQMETYDMFAHTAEHGTICETGFNGGHSAVRFLAQSQAVLYEFDLGEHAYAKAAADYLQNRFPGRLHNIWGDSAQTLPAFTADPGNSLVKCDILVVDGGHEEAQAMADLTNFAAMANVRGHYLAIDDTPCDLFWCKGPGKAWKQLISEGCIEEISAAQDSPHHGFSFGRYTKCARWPQFTS